MKKLYQLLLDRWNQKTDTVLVTIVEGNGSVPRTTGAYMAVAKNGRIYGTIGGGNLEYQAVKKAMELAGTAAHYVENFDLGTGENSELGMVCGGRVKVLFYSACAQDPGVGEFLKEALAAADEGKPYWLVIPFSEGLPQIRKEITEGRGHCRIFGGKRTEDLRRRILLRWKGLHFWRRSSGSGAGSGAQSSGILVYGSG